ncbi:MULTISPECIES: tail protein X [Pseudomonas]|jgi:phage tail protein X|uniref:tail protein X n=1 Tax=Pseudomonas TaxID=286 RepID=UPI000C86A208|nr:MULTISPECIES: tail protein X [Pseudomonas]MBA4359415.1 phage tail protein [Pseudomonas sp.]MSU96338.1 phage tail protein [Pseudomonas mandelii]PMV86034.1 phage tail protein [Pseudomonas sp. GW101-1A09]PMV90706.1 phage tail protein [Pseudomonas sp. FW306-2-2C-B10A]PMV97374.1 phage tail protein [Pseudomonas sp. GW460-C8]
MHRVRSIAGDSANLLLYRELGRCDDAVEEALWRLNPGLAEYAAVLPAGVWVVLPELDVKPVAPTPVSAWD